MSDPKRRRFQFSIWSLLVVLLIVSVPLGWLSFTRKKQLDEQNQLALIARSRVSQHVASPSERLIFEALDEATILEFDGETLEETIDFLGELHRIPFTIDGRALDEAGLNASIPIHLDLRAVSLRSGLNILLRQHGLTYVVRDEVLLITTIKGADSSDSRILRAYNVADILNHDRGPQLLTDTMHDLFADSDLKYSVYHHLLFVRAPYAKHVHVAELLELARRNAM